MSEIVAITLEAELVNEDAEREIAEAVSARHSIARKYVIRLRRRHPDATPAEVIRMLERHYATSITTVGAVIAAGGIAAEVGISMIPGGGAAAVGVKAASQQVAKKAAQEVVKGAAKEAAKSMALGAAKSGAQKVAAFLPAGDQQLQFEITAIFGLAVADIHGMNLDQDQAHALVYGLTNERVSQQQIATMAADLAHGSSVGTVEVKGRAAGETTDWSHWASTLADTLPAGAAQNLVRTVQTGHLDTMQETLSGKQKATVEYGVGAVVGGITRFVFGRDVINSARVAFPGAPDAFPEHLLVPVKSQSLSDEGEEEPNRALAALEDAARTTGTWITGTAGAVGGTVATGAAAVGTGVATAAGSVSRPFRSVDIDGDGIPDEAQALTAVKGVGGAIAGVASSMGGGVAGLFKSKKRSATASDVEQIERIQQLLSTGVITSEEAQTMKVGSSETTDHSFVRASPFFDG